MEFAIQVEVGKKQNTCVSQVLSLISGVIFAQFVRFPIYMQRVWKLAEALR